MHVYTKKGDHGKTRLADGTEHDKSEEVFDMIGTIDELNSWVGICRTELINSFTVGAHNCEPHGAHHGVPLQRIQNNLFAIDAILALSKTIKFDVYRETKLLEREIDKMESELSPLKNFILPGGTELAAKLHICRTICRRAERRLISCSYLDTSQQELIPYFNRLSDYFFTLARFVNFKSKTKEIIWKK